MFSGMLTHGMALILTLKSSPSFLQTDGHFPDYAYLAHVYSVRCLNPLSNTDCYIITVVSHCLCQYWVTQKCFVFLPPDGTSLLRLERRPRGELMLLMFSALDIDASYLPCSFLWFPPRLPSETEVKTARALTIST